jgi:hypothetical protein
MLFSSAGIILIRLTGIFSAPRLHAWQHPDRCAAMIAQLLRGSIAKIWRSFCVLEKEEVKKRKDQFLLSEPVQKCAMTVCGDNIKSRWQ